VPADTTTAPGRGWQVRNLDISQTEPAETGQRRRQHLQRADRQGFEWFLVVVKRAVRVHLDLHAGFAALLGEMLESFRAFAISACPVRLNG